MDRDIYWLARHEGWHAAIARGVAAGDAQCIEVAAKLFSLYLPDDEVDSFKVERIAGQMFPTDEEQKGESDAE